LEHNTIEEQKSILDKNKIDNIHKISLAELKLLANILSQIKIPANIDFDVTLSADDNFDDIVEFRQTFRRNFACWNF